MDLLSCPQQKAIFIAIIHLTKPFFPHLLLLVYL